MCGNRDTTRSAVLWRGLARLFVFMTTSRLIVAVDYQRQAVFIRFIGTHAQYDAIDAEVV
jgi:HigB_toxin, RelE-like toxic component of a toxin-antitoxin system